MRCTPTHLEGCCILEPDFYHDKRGSFSEIYNQKVFNSLIGYNVDFVQDNLSISTYGVLRGLHYQKGNSAQAKLVRVIVGKVWDIAVDIRPSSATFGQYIGVELSAENHKQLFVPRGFAHGFVVLSDTATFTYKCDNYYNPKAEHGIIYNDPNLCVDWKLPRESLIVSEKDLELPILRN